MDTKFISINISDFGIASCNILHAYECNIGIFFAELLHIIQKDLNITTVATCTLCVAPNAEWQHM